MKGLRWNPLRFGLHVVLLVSLLLRVAVAAAPDSCHCDTAMATGDPPNGCDGSSANATYNSDPVVDRFRRYLRLRTDQPMPNYCCAIVYLRNQVEQIGGLDMKEVSYGKTIYKPLLIVTWNGTDPNLPSILLNSHTDVVEADASRWKHDPYCAFMEANGDIYARGAQDTKNAGMLYLEAIRHLKQQAFVPTRTIHVTFTPDEEVGGAEGFEAFSKSADFAGLNVGIAMDEGGVTSTANFTLYNQEKPAWWLTLQATGPPTHGAFMIENGALENLFTSIDRVMAFRQGLVEKQNQGVPTAFVTTISPTYLNAGITTATGYVSNIQPGTAIAGFDIRLAINENSTALLERVVNEWAPASLNMTHEFVSFNEILEPSVANVSNPFWSLLKQAVESTGYTLSDPQVVPAFTDARFVSAKHIPAFNFAPVSHTPNRYHADNEFMNAAIYLSGFPVYESILRAWSQFTGQCEQRSSIEPHFP